MKKSKMGAVNYKIIIAGLCALTLIEWMLLFFDADSQNTTYTIVGAICLAIGIIIPTPKIDEKKGELKW